MFTDQTPIAKDAEHEVSQIDFPEDGPSKCIKYVIGNSGQGGNSIILKFLLDVGTQLIPSPCSVVNNQPHLLSHLFVDAKAWTIAIIQSLVRFVIAYHQFAVLQLQFDEGSLCGIIRRSMKILCSKFRSRIVVDASLLEKGDHGTHESNTRHIGEHLIQVVTVKIRITTYMSPSSIQSCPIHLEQYGRIV